MTQRGDEKPRVLMVDDDLDFHAIVRGWLAPRFEHVAMTSGEGLLEQLEALEPDLLILDVRMPGAGGFELCAQVRSERRFDALPILFLTGCKEDEDFVSNLKAGGTAFLSKPVGRRLLVATLRGLIPDRYESIGVGD